MAKTKELSKDTRNKIVDLHQAGKTESAIDIHTEAVQAALALHKVQKMALPMPTKRWPAGTQPPARKSTPLDTSSASEDEGSLHRWASLNAALTQNQQSPDCWINRSVQGSSTSSSASSTLSHGEGKPQPALLADVLAHTRIENTSVPPNVTSAAVHERGIWVDLPPTPPIHAVSRGQNRSSVMETADGVPVNSRVSTKIQQLLNTLKRPKRPPLSEFFVDDAEEIVEVPQPDPNTPKPEGRQIIPVKGEPLGVVSNWPPALQAALARWGATQAKSPALTALDITGKTLYTLTYGWPRLKWVVTDSKYLTKPFKDWQPHIPTANTDPAYIEDNIQRVMRTAQAPPQKLAPIQDISAAAEEPATQSRINMPSHFITTL
ncbi:hypothetical protein SKAU_G00155640 [Synaphobranchus kaupii]|uniref:Uncharacterized protein n=1 Tax=Synaphobranchus kaupii TaxID=118154 RepID=A0A9Q1IX43_SYNKA|nr:hypothetical protein SKAU_G00155640 [Synaphobranchus kaupii]